MSDIVKMYVQFKQWRISHGVRLVQVAAYCKTTPASISRWENGKMNLNESYVKSYQQFIMDYELGRLKN